jgi:hypothetical protein
LVDELGYGNFGKVAVGLVADETHREDVAQGDCDEVRMLADQQLEPTCEVFIWRLFHIGFLFLLPLNDYTRPRRI